MRFGKAAVLLAIAMALAGCGGQGSGSGTLEVTKNGTYDVSGYAEVVVNVGGEVQGDEVAAGEEEAVSDIDTLDLERVQFSRFSMEVPSVMVEGYTEAELTENDNFNFSYEGDEDKYVISLSVSVMDLLGLDTPLERFSDAPQVDVNGIIMAVRHEHSGDRRRVESMFIHDGILYTIDLYYPVEKDDLFAEYGDSFYKSIQMN